jgi:hypothetical protein
MPCGEHEVGADQSHRAGRKNVNLRCDVFGFVDMDDHADAPRGRLADVRQWRDALDVLPNRRRVAEPERIVFSGRWLVIVATSEERIAIRQRRWILVSAVALASCIFVDLHAAVRRAIGDVTHRDLAIRERADIDRPGPEIRAIGRSENIRVVTEVDFDAVVGRKDRIDEMENEELCPHRRQIMGEANVPCVGRVGRIASIGSNRLDGCDGLNCSNNMRHGKYSYENEKFVWPKVAAPVRQITGRNQNVTAFGVLSKFRSSRAVARGSLLRNALLQDVTHFCQGNRVNGFRPGESHLDDWPWNEVGYAV